MIATLSLFLLLHLTTTMSNLQNPIVRGFSPDPSVCRVNDDFYLVNSSFAYFPGVPIRHSRNLSDWELIGHCLTRPSQLPLVKIPIACGIYAPTLRYHAGKFYMITTNVAGGGNFLVTATDIRGPWSEPVWIHVDSIDPSLFWDDDGTCYLTVNGASIRQAVIDPSTGKLLSELQPIWTGTGGRYPEGPHLFKRNGMYYLTVAEGGTEFGHMQTLARSAKPMGPFQPCPHNPILTHRSLVSPFQAIGHADFFDDGKGNWWAVCLGIRPKGYPETHCLGRETFLVPVKWGDDGWPVLGDSGRVPLALDLPVQRSAVQPQYIVFGSGGVPVDWSYLRNPRPQSYEPHEDFLRLKGTHVSLADIDSPTWIGCPQCWFDSEFVVNCTASTAADGEAGLSVFQNERHRAELFFQGENVCLRLTIGPLSVVTKRVPVHKNAGKLVVRTRDEHYEFAYDDGTSSVTLGSIESKYLSTEVGGGFTGVMLGAYAYAPDGDSSLDLQSVDYSGSG
ncbi:MAG: family 43 glycosylhydrolase [Fimbriimonas sp.]|nr:family 43 glycosylhydrolase [Fimbriimonas sp.]